MRSKNRARLNLEQLESRLVPTTASFSNGVLTVLGDNAGNNINVSVASNGDLQVTERGKAVTIKGGTATSSNTTLVVEEAGTGNNNTLATSASLGSIATDFTGNGGGVITYAPGNSGPSTAYRFVQVASWRSTTSLATPAARTCSRAAPGEETFFDWEPGTARTGYLHRRRRQGSSAVLVVGNTSGSAETDTLTTDSHGDVIFTRQNLVPFTLTTSGIQDWYLEPSTGAGNTVRIGDLTGTVTKRVEVDASSSTIYASNQEDASVKLVVNVTQEHGKCSQEYAPGQPR